MNQLFPLSPEDTRLLDKAEELAGNEWVFRGDSLEPVGLPKQWRELFRAPMKLPRSRVPLFLSQELVVLEAESEVDANFGIDEFTLEPQSPRFILALNGGLTQVQAQLQCAYGPRIMTVGVTAKDESLWLPDPKSTTRYSTRAFGAEVAAAERMRRAGFNGPDSQGRWNLSPPGVFGYSGGGGTLPRIRWTTLKSVSRWIGF